MKRGFGKRCGLAMFFTLSPALASAQGTLEDYQRAERFLPGNVRHLYVAT